MRVRLLSRTENSARRQASDVATRDQRSALITTFALRVRRSRHFPLDGVLCRGRRTHAFFLVRAMENSGRNETAALGGVSMTTHATDALLARLAAAQAARATINEKVDKSGFMADAKPIQDDIAKKLGPHAVKLLQIVRDVK